VFSLKESIVIVGKFGTIHFNVKVVQSIMVEIAVLQVAAIFVRIVASQVMT
jgi:hypothetical protein